MKLIKQGLLCKFDVNFITQLFKVLMIFFGQKLQIQNINKCFCCLFFSPQPINSYLFFEIQALDYYGMQWELHHKCHNIENNIDRIIFTQRYNVQNTPIMFNVLVWETNSIPVNLSVH